MLARTFSLNSLTFLSSTILNNFIYLLKLFCFCLSLYSYSSVLIYFVTKWYYSFSSITYRSLSLIFMRFYRVYDFISKFLIPSGLISKDWVLIDILLPILAATKGFCFCVAIGQAKVLENTSIMGTFCRTSGFLNTNVVFISSRGSAVSLA